LAVGWLALRAGPEISGWARSGSSGAGGGLSWFVGLRR